MPAGCDFVCKNENCDYKNTGFTITGPWAMGSINDILNSKRLKDNQELKEEMRDLKNSGRDYACITFPNVDNIKTKCYRVNLWSVEGKCLWQYDVVVEKGDDLETAIRKSNLPDECPNTGSEMLTYHQAISNGIYCPKCSQKLHQNRWFTKEV